MNGEAKDLRELARTIEETAKQSRAFSMAAGAVSALCEYLCLRARLMELEGRAVK